MSKKAPTKQIGLKKKKKKVSDSGDYPIGSATPGSNKLNADTSTNQRAAGGVSGPILALTSVNISSLVGGKS